VKKQRHEEKYGFHREHSISPNTSSSAFVRLLILAQSQTLRISSTETQAIPGDVTGDRSQTVSASTLSNLSIYFQNVNRARQKTNELYFSVCSSDFDIIILLETNFNDDFFNEELFDNRFTYFMGLTDLP
jgi:hypothetical protein